ncbi:MAG TPA: DUF1697 domain-containing protein [Terriglobales bacterium]
MTAMICLLRGVNVGGHNQIKMDALRALCESLKLCNAQTYIQSGNVVFQAKENDPEKLAARIESAIENKHGFRPDVVLRTASEMRDVIAHNPFAKRKGIEPNKLAVMFLAHEPEKAIQDAVRKLAPEVEELHLVGREIYINFPDGMGRSKLVPLLARVLKNAGTARNWNTVVKLLEMAERLEGKS